jgi:ABC-type polysaccharide/polyol phosphate export permease
MSLHETFVRRELLWNLTLRELRTRYRKSILGWTWSLLNPLSTMVIFTIVFKEIFGQPPIVGSPSGLTSYPLYLLSGLLPWTFFTTTVSTSMGAVLGGSSLIRRVAFPHESLVVSSALSLIVSLSIEMTVLSVALLLAGNMVIPWLVPLVGVLLLLMVFSIGVALVLSALNVFFRDVNYLWNVLVQAWFYLTPVVYALTTVPGWIAKLAGYQPMGCFVVVIHNLIFDMRWPDPIRWVYLTVVSFVTLAIGQWVFKRFSPRFAEEM